MYKIDAIREAAKSYGEEAVKHESQCRQLGTDIIAEMNKFLHPGGAAVRGVPPEGDWNPDGEWRGEVFSSYNDDILSLEDVQFGIAIRVDNLEDDGFFWIRLTLMLRGQKDAIEVFVGERSGIKVSLEYGEDDLGVVCEAIYEEVLNLFRLPIRRRSNQASAIGFRLS